MKSGILLLAVAMVAVVARAQESITSPGRIEEIVHATQEQFWQLVPPAFGAGDDFIYIHPDSTVPGGGLEKQGLAEGSSQAALCGNGNY